MARGRNMKGDFRKIKLVNIARWQEGTQLLQIGLSQHISFFELGQRGQIRADPPLDIFPSGQTLALRVRSLRAYPAECQGQPGRYK